MARGTVLAHRWHKSPFLRIAIILPLVTGLLIGAMLVPVYDEAINYIRKKIHGNVLIETNELLDRALTPPTEDLVELLRRRIAEPIEEDAIYLYVRGDRIVIGNLPYWPEEVPRRDGEVFHIYLEDGRSLIGRVSAIPEDGFLLVGRRGPLAEFRQHMGRQLVLSAIGVTLLCGLITFFFMRQMQRRLASLAREAAIVGGGNASYRLAARADGDELDELAGRFNDALARIEQLMEAARHVSSAIAHDMRRPLIRLRNRIEQARESPTGEIALDDMRAETDYVLRSFAALLRLARIEAGTLESTWAPLALEPLLADIAELFEPVAHDRGRKLTVRSQPCAVRGDRELLQQALSNLIENALEHGAGDIMLSLAPAAQGGVLLSVRDHGSGVPTEALPHLFERFYRVDPSRGGGEGAGIGLALVAGIAAHHGGSVTAENAYPGLRVCLHLPATDMA